MVSDTLDGPQVAATFPFNLPGRFEKIDESVTELTTRDLFRKELPVCVNVDKQDPGIGFDPLISKKSFQVKKIVSGMLIAVVFLFIILSFMLPRLFSILFTTFEWIIKL